jgi:hypothetical protein
MSEGIAAIKQVYEQQLKAHYLAQYIAYCQEKEGGDRYDLGQSNRVAEEAIAALPQAVQTFQQEALDQGDSYYANVYQISADQQLTYGVRITTDGDDGWLAVFDQQGQSLASAQTYLEVVVWADAQILRAKEAIDLLANPLPGFEAAKSQTLWGKPLSELEPDMPAKPSQSDAAESDPQT